MTVTIATVHKWSGGNGSVSRQEDQRRNGNV